MDTLPVFSFDCETVAESPALEDPTPVVVDAGPGSERLVEASVLWLVASRVVCRAVAFMDAESGSQSSESSSMCGGQEGVRRKDRERERASTRER